MLTCLACLAKHSRSRWRFQFLASILNAFFEFLVLKVNEINSSKIRTDEQKLDFKKKVKGGEDRTERDLAVTAAGKVAHHTKAERENFTVRKLLQDARKRSRGECSRIKPGKQGLNTW